MPGHTPRSVTLHGHDLQYLDVGSGPVLLFVHGLLGSHEQWVHLVDDLARDHRVIAPDLFGHGASAKPMGDYSLGAHAASLRDLLDHLGVRSATLVGHSLGGGIVLQLAYLFPERAERLVLVGSGGLGRELGVLLRAASLPGAELVIPVLASTWVREQVESAARLLGWLGLRADHEMTQVWRGISSLSTAESRRSFLATTRAVVDPGGQTVGAGERLALAGGIPTLLVWGARDRMIPSSHAVSAHAAIVGSRVEIFEGVGHFPHLEAPYRFATVLREFVDEASAATG
jgi:pimeloyl-ACP methyl ester carboxylesterase